MNERDRLIELLSQYFNIGDSYAYNLTRVKSAFGVGTMSMDDFEEFDDDTIDELADHLLANGVIVPPVKLGDLVYTIVRVPHFYRGETRLMAEFVHKVYYFVVGSIVYNEDGVFVTEKYSKQEYALKECFLNEEEAERALKEREHDV